MGCSIVVYIKYRLCVLVNILKVSRISIFQEIREIQEINFWSICSVWYKILCFLRRPDISIRSWSKDIVLGTHRLLSSGTSRYNTTGHVSFDQSQITTVYQLALGSWIRLVNLRRRTSLKRRLNVFRLPVDWKYRNFFQCVAFFWILFHFYQNFSFTLVKNSLVSYCFILSVLP